MAGAEKTSGLTATDALPEKQPVPANTVSGSLQKAGKKPHKNSAKPYTCWTLSAASSKTAPKVQAACIWSGDRLQLREPAVEVALHTLNPHAFALFENARFKFIA